MIREESKERLRRVKPRGPALRPAHKQKLVGEGPYIKHQTKPLGKDGGNFPSEETCLIMQGQ